LYHFTFTYREKNTRIKKFNRIYQEFLKSKHMRSNCIIWRWIKRLISANCEKKRAQINYRLIEHFWKSANKKLLNINRSYKKTISSVSKWNQSVVELLPNCYFSSQTPLESSALWKLIASSNLRKSKTHSISALFSLRAWTISTPALSQYLDQRRLD